MSLNQRERTIFTMLASKVRGVGLAQLLRARFPETSAGRINGRRWVAERERLGLLETFNILGRVVDDVELVYRGDARTPPPDFAELSRESCRRWNIAPQPMTVVRATPRLRNIVGGPSPMRFRALGQIGHDIGCSLVYLKFLREAPELASAWIGEDEITEPAYRQAKADAMILNDDGSVERVVEFASGYQAEKFEKFDRTFRPCGIPYEIYMRTDK
jgi:hypothetical protein